RHERADHPRVVFWSAGFDEIHVLQRDPDVAEQYREPRVEHVRNVLDADRDPPSAEVADIGDPIANPQLEATGVQPAEYLEWQTVSDRSDREFGVRAREVRQIPGDRRSRGDRRIHALEVRYA